MQGQIFIFCDLCEDHRNGDDTDAAEAQVCDDTAEEAQVCDDIAAEAEEVQHKPDAAEAGEEQHRLAEEERHRPLPGSQD